MDLHSSPAGEEVHDEELVERVLEGVRRPSGREHHGVEPHLAAAELAVEARGLVG